MTDSSGSRQFSLRRAGCFATAAVGLFLSGFAVALLIWLFPGGGVWRSDVSIVNVELRSPDVLTLIVSSCNGNPGVSLYQETDTEVQVKVRSSSTPFRGGPDCQGSIDLYLLEPLGDRIVVDQHTGQEVNVDIVDWPADE